VRGARVCGRASRVSWPQTLIALSATYLSLPETRYGPAAAIVVEL
jgi:hypothetical protein